QEIVKIETLLQAKRDDLQQIVAVREEAQKVKPLVQEQLHLEKRSAELQKRLTELHHLNKKAQQDEQALRLLRAEYQELHRKVQETDSLKSLVERLPELEKNRDDCEVSLRQAQVTLERLVLRRQEIKRSKEYQAKLSAEIKTLEAELINIPVIE